MEKNFRDNILNVITKNSLLSPNDSVLVAVSGGADSVCLLDVLVSLKDTLSIKIYVAHLNHLLRGEEATRDEEFVKSLCDKYSVPFFLKRVDVKKLAKENKTSLENAGRDARYEFFNELKDRHHITKIATAHNKNDNVETVCMRFMRGTGISGLSGIPLENDSSVIRPLLFTSRSEIEAYIKDRNLSFVTDSTNLETDFTRNKIRHKLIPYIEENHNESFIDTLSHNIELLSDANSYLKKITEEKFNSLVKYESFGLSFNLDKLLTEDIYIIKSVIKKAILTLSEKDASSKTVSLVYDLAVATNDLSQNITDSLMVYKRYGVLYFVAKKNCSFFYEKGENDEIEIFETGAKITFSKNGVKEQNDKNTIYLKIPKKTQKITVRNRKDGDKIYLGKSGHKKIKDLFIDEKIPVFLRNEIPLLLIDDEIVWACTVRANPDYLAKDNEEYIKISYSKEKNI